ncbi:MAG TPA: hypothetical protein VJT15_18895 [Pyrinomonadaceae bacterium]|nr:hypothetical protein [Pyrinomonadaceae bacterium]
MRTLTKLIALSLLLITGRVSVLAQHKNQNYLPLTKAELRKRFPITYVGTLGNGSPAYFENNTSDKPLATNLDIGPSGAAVRMTDESDLEITGKDKRQREWSIQLGSNAYGCRFYEADLDKNATRDAVIVFPTGGNGLAPANHLLAITFDEDGRPVTFEADGYFQETGGAIFDLVDLDQNGRAELIYMNFDSGYWITNIYEVTNARWHRKSGRHANRVYPLYTRFTFRANNKPTAPRQGRRPFAPDLSNATPQLAGRLVSYQWARIAYSEDISLVIQDTRGRSVTSKPVSWYASFAIVVDSEEGRKILTLSASEDAMKSLLDTIVSNDYEILLFGKRRPDESSPEILWARRR